MCISKTKQNTKDNNNNKGCAFCIPGTRISVPECYWRSHIEHGYRTPFLEFKKVFYSLFTLHNETTNIWSHLLGFIFMIYAIYYYFQEKIYYINIKELINHELHTFEKFIDTTITTSNIYNNNNNDNDSSILWIENLCFGFFLISAAICFLFSTIYHWFNCLSPTHHDHLLMLDLTGIAMLVGSSYLPAAYFGFYCHPTLQITYLICSALVLTLGLVAVWIEMEVYKVSKLYCIYTLVS